MVKPAVLFFAGVLGLAVPAAAEARTAKAKPKVASTRAAKKLSPRAPKLAPNQTGKIVVFAFKEDDDRSISSQVERLLRAKGLEIVSGVRPVDTAEQYREMAGTMGLVAYVDGSVREGASNARVTVQLRSGYTGRKVAVASFNETKLHLRGEIEDKLWTRLGPAMARACVDAGKPRRRGRGPLVIEAGTPLADSSGN